MYLSIKEEQYEAIKRLPEEKQGKMLLVMGRYIFE
jgi:hypothetical protein